MSKSLKFAVCAISICSLSGIALPCSAEQTIQVVAQKFAFNPPLIKVKKGEPVTLEISSKDVKHGFNAPDLGIRSVITPGQVSKVTFTPEKAGSYVFYCDVFCGSGHDNMSGKIEVTN